MFDFEYDFKAWHSVIILSESISFNRQFDWLNEHVGEISKEWECDLEGFILQNGHFWIKDPKMAMLFKLTFG